MDAPLAWAPELVARRAAFEAMFSGLPQRAAAPPVQAKWKNDTVTVATRDEMERTVGIERKHVDESEEAGAALVSSTVFLVPPTAELKANIESGQALRAVPVERHIIGESSHGAATWPNATSPWPYVPKMRERFKTFEKPGEDNVAGADKPLEDKVGGDERARTGDLALEGLSEYAITALSLAQQLLKGYDSVYDLKGGGSEKTKKDYYEILHSRLTEAYVVMLRYNRIGAGLPEKKTPKEQALFEMAIHIEVSDAFKQMAAISKSPVTGEVTELGGWWQRNVGKKIQDMQALIENVANRIIALEKYPNMGSIAALNTSPDRGRDDWADRVDQVITSAPTRDIREHEMARRINAAAPPFMAQVGRAHIPGLTQKGASGLIYADEAEFVRRSTKPNKPDVYETRMAEDRVKHRTMDLWG